MSRFWSQAGMVLGNRRHNPLWVAGLGMASLLALSGCAAIQVKLGMKVYLAKIPVTSIEVRQANDPGIGPGQKSSLIVEVTQPDGKILQTEGAGKGKVMWQDLVVTPTLVTVNKKGGPGMPRAPEPLPFLVPPSGGSTGLCPALLLSKQQGRASTYSIDLPSPPLGL